jgi:hypothetical protein
MNDFQKNKEIMAYSLAQMMAPLVTLSEDDSLNVYDLPLGLQDEIADKMYKEYRNKIEIDPLMVRTIPIEQAYAKALLSEFYSSISDSCEEWIRTIQKDDKQ